MRIVKVIETIEELMKLAPKKTRQEGDKKEYLPGLAKIVFDSNFHQMYLNAGGAYQMLDVLRGKAPEPIAELAKRAGFDVAPRNRS